MSALPLVGRVALVTGAAGGIGAATCAALAAAGADVALNDLHVSPRLNETAAQVRSRGRRALPVLADVADQNAVEAMVAGVVAELGRIDILVTTAVYSDREPFTTGDMAGFRKTMDVSLWGSFFALRAVANRMLKQGTGGAIVVVSSPHAHVAFPNCMAYNMAKAAQDQMARTASIELFSNRIRVNLVHPGWTDTPGEDRIMKTYHNAQDGWLGEAEKKLPFGRLLKVDEISRAVAYLATEESGLMTGSIIDFDQQVLGCAESAPQPPPL